MTLGAAVAVITMTAGYGGWVNSATAASSTITVGGMAPLSSQVLALPEIKAGIVADIDALNAQGGIDGHQVKLDFCDTQYTSAGEINCMDQMISDKVSAVIAPAVEASQSGAPYRLAQNAHLANIGTLGVYPSEFNSPVVFPLASGNPGWIYGSIASLVSGGSRRIALMGNDEGASAVVDSLARQALKLAGLTPTNDVIGDSSSDPTFSAAAAKAVAGKINGLFLFVDPDYVPAAVRAVRAAGYTGPISSLSSIITPQIVTALGPAANGMELTSSVSVDTDTSNPAVAAFLSDMKKYQPQATLDAESESAWAAMQLYAKLMKGATNFSASHVLNLLQNLSAPIDVGVTGPYVVKGAKPLLAGYPNIFNPDVAYGVIRNGLIQPSGSGLVNPFKTLKEHSHG
jgi:ABC-type branched-subunit amino acid transport system substrate-binding protein